MKTVYLNDTGISYEQAEPMFNEAAAWAKEHCSSFVGFHIQDVSDVSYYNDYVTEYRFKDPKDAMLFQLRWKNS